MQIVRFGDRYFVAHCTRDVHDISLKILNEQRILGTLPENAKGFVEAVCEEMDGESAWRLAVRLYDVEMIAPEIL